MRPRKFGRRTWTPAKLVTREAWGAGPRGATPSSHPIPDPWGVTLHWEGPHMGTWGHELCARKVRTIQRFHKITRGWADIAYSAVVCPHGYVFEGRGPNVQTAANGTSSIGGNDHWYAVCYLGGEGDPFTPEARAGYFDAVRWLRTAGGAGDRVNGHRDHHSTECPGNEIYTWLRAADWTHIADTQQEGDDMPSPEDLWSFKLSERDSSTTKVDDAPAGKLLGQAHNRAGDARRLAHDAAVQARHNADAIEELAKGLEQLVPGIAGAVVGKLGDRISVELKLEDEGDQ